MKIFAIADIHVDGKNKNTAYQLPTKLMHHVAKEKDQCIVIFLGDVAQNLPLLHNYLKLFQNIPIQKLFVAGNHDVWVKEGPDSLLKYQLLLKEAVEDSGFHYLDSEPFIFNRIGFIGNIGWYDYSFKSLHSKIPENFKLLRKSTTQYIDWSELNELDYQEKELMAESFGNLFVLTSWNDRLYVRWDFSDAEFTKRCLNKIKMQFDQINQKVDKIVFCSHHVHFQEGVIFKNKAQWDFNNAFVGSKEIGNYVLSQKKVDLLLFAHTHERGVFKIDHRIPAYNPAYQSHKTDFMVIEYP